MTKTKRIVTIYTMGGFGIHRQVGDLQAMAEKPYAQYPMVPMVQFVPKGKRKPVVASGNGFHTWIVVVEGEGPDRDDPLTRETIHEATGLGVSKSRYSSFAPEWTVEADSLIATIDRSRIIADYRHTISQEQWVRFPSTAKEPA